MGYTSPTGYTGLLSSRLCFAQTRRYLQAVDSYFVEDLVDPISIFAGVVQTGLYLDFFYVYFTKYASLPPYKRTLTHLH